MISYANTLKELRKSHNLTQGEIANLIGIERSTYAYYERGTTKPDFECLLKLSKIYNIELNDITTMLLNDSKSYVSFKSIDNVEFDKEAFLNDLDMLNVDEYEKLMLYFYRNLPDAFRKLFFMKVKQNYDDIYSIRNGS